ncbi:hypothetical protein Rs2_52478 [Raphanus sativus]|nr:hypothetical protein Rs2_52478 [Raphanus sativus]
MEGLGSVRCSAVSLGSMGRCSTGRVVIIKSRLFCDKPSRGTPAHGPQVVVRLEPGPHPLTAFPQDKLSPIDLQIIGDSLSCGMLLKGEDLGSSLTNNLIMEIVRSHNRGVGVGALQRCEPGVHGQVFHGTGCHNQLVTACSCECC